LLMEIQTGSLKKMNKLVPTILEGGRKGIKIGNEIYLTNYLQIITKSNGSLLVNKKPFRGDLEIFVVSQNSILIVNRVGLEDYLRGVVSGEMPKRWPENALGAQTIAARTYALYKKGIRRQELFDLYSDVTDQVYGGMDYETRATDKIIKKTEGVVIIHNDTLLPAFFHSCCGGNTEMGKNVFDVDVPSLASVKCDFCKDSPYFRWIYTLKWEVIEKNMNKYYPHVEGEIESISVKKRTQSGRATTLEIKTSDNIFEWNAKKFRLQTDTRLLKSTKFNITTSGNKIVFKGAGWGHGVGLCQWGAKGLAERHLKTEEIISFYYPGTKLVKIQ